MIEEIVGLFCQGCMFALNLYLMWKQKNQDDNISH